MYCGVPSSAPGRVRACPPPVSGGWLQRKIGGLAWRVAAPFFERQQAFNAALVDHVNRGLPIDKANREAIAAGLHYTRDALGEIRAFQSTLIVYFQQLTSYVDTKDFEHPGAAAIVATVKKEVSNGPTILFHDAGGDRAQTVAALREALPWLKQQGYSFGFPVR